MKYRYSILFLLFIVLLNGCSLSTKDAEPQAQFKPGVQAVLPPPESKTSFKRRQFLTVTVNGKTETLTTTLEFESDRIALTGLTSRGIPLFSAVYSPLGLQIEQPKELPPIGQMLTDILLSYRPTADWATLLPHGWSLKDEMNKRLLRDEQGKVVVEINYQYQRGKREPINIAQYALNYHILILNIDD